MRRPFICLLLTLRRTPEGRWLIVSDMDNGNRGEPDTAA
jgi:hypothetical protein